MIHIIFPILQMSKMKLKGSKIVHISYVAQEWQKIESEDTRWVNTYFLWIYFVLGPRWNPGDTVGKSPPSPAKKTKTKVEKKQRQTLVL